MSQNSDTQQEYQFQHTAPAVAKRTVWTEPMDLAMLEVFLEAKKDGTMTRNGYFKKPVWTKAVSAVSAVTSQKVDRVNLDTRWRTQIKSIWKLWIAHTASLGNLSEWAFDETMGTFTSSEDVMSRHFTKHPEYERFRETGPRYRDKMEELLGSWGATGKYARSSLSFDTPAPPFDDESVTLMNVSAAPSHTASEAATAGPGEKRKRTGAETTDDRMRKCAKEDPMLEAIHQIKQQAAESSEKLRLSMRSAKERAKSAFSDECEELFPDTWGQKERARHVFRGLDVLDDEDKAHTFLALQNRSKTMRFMWMSAVLGLSPEYWPDSDNDDDRGSRV